MVLYRFAVPALALALATTGLGTARALGAPAAPIGQDRGGWDAPPGEYNEIQRRGFRDGMEGARKDYENHRRADVNNRDEYRQPALPRELRQVYREGFRRGYERGVAHMYGDRGRGDRDRPIQEPERMRQPEREVREHDRGGWDAPPGEYNEVQQRGFRDGMQGARRDVENHRRPDVNNRDEYRNPGVPFELRRPYRVGFRRGYEVAMEHLMNGDRR